MEAFCNALLFFLLCTRITQAIGGTEEGEHGEGEVEMDEEGTPYIYVRDGEEDYDRDKDGAHENVYEIAEGGEDVEEGLVYAEEVQEDRPDKISYQ